MSASASASTSGFALASAFFAGSAVFDTDLDGWQIPRMRLLGLDVGAKTIGVAVCDDDGIVATPLRTLPRHGGERDLQAVGAVVQETGAKALVVGLPLDLSGDEGDAARRVRALGEALAAHLACPVHYWDERFSTAAAERALLEGNVRRKRRKEVINHVAAALILQSFIESSAGRALQVARDTP